MYLEIKATEECTGTLDLQERMESLVYLETKVALKPSLFIHIACISEFSVNDSTLSRTPGEKGDSGVPGEPGSTGEPGPQGGMGAMGLPGMGICHSYFLSHTKISFTLHCARYLWGPLSICFS